MSASFTTSTARNIFYGGTVFFFLLFLALTYQNEQALPARDNRANLTPQVVAGKKIWETRNCVGCHTLLSDKELNEIAAFLKYVSEINAAKWPPNNEG